MFGGANNEKEDNPRQKEKEQKKIEEMIERGYSDFFLYLTEICESLIMKGHNTEFRNPYNYPIRTILARAKIISGIEDKERALSAQINLTTNIASSGWGGKDSAKHFKDMIKKLNGV